MTKPAIQPAAPTAPWYAINARANRHAEVFIFGDIGDGWADETVTARKFVAEIAALSVDTMTVRINSVGGSVPDGLAIYNALRRYPARVSTVVESVAASIASLIAMAGETVSMAENAMLMIHAPWSAAQGNANDLREMAGLLDKFAAAMASSYVRPGGLDHAAALALLTDGADHWYSAEEAKAAGLIDTITAKTQVAASLTGRFAPPFFLAAAATATNSPQGQIMPEENTTTVAPSTVTPQAGLQHQAPIGASAPETIAPVDADAIRAQVLQDDATRRRNIAAIAGPWYKGPSARTDVQALVQTAQDQGHGVDTFRKDLLAMIGRNVVPLGHGLIYTVEDESDKFRAGVTGGLLIRAGLTTMDSSNEFRGYTLTELARACLTRRNIATKGMDKMGVVAAAFTHSTSDFTNLLADVANKALLKGWQESEETFQQWTSRGTLPDFKASKRVDLNTFPALSKVEQGAEYTYATVGDRGETIQLATYGKLFSITRHAIVNDDLDSFTRIPAKMGRAAIRTVGNLVYAVLTGNPTMADGVALFHANHANLLTAAALSTASVDIAAATMAKQTDATGNTLNINMAYLVVPRALWGLARTIASAENEITSAKTATTPNWMKDTFQVIADPRLDVSSASNWFCAANPMINDTIEVAYLDGNDAPTLEQQGGWTVDGVEFKVRIDAGVKALDHRGLAKNPN
jgi:ATP-dependent Clp endopeptidase proteolytic subunit ClpP